MAAKTSKSLAVPKTQLRRRTERVLDARCCVLSGCKFLQTGTDPATGQPVRSCGAAVWKASLPAEQLQDEVRRNANPQPGHDAESNPFLLRLLMAPECVRPECGVAEVQHTEKVLVVDREELESELFSR